MGAAMTDEPNPPFHDHWLRGNDEAQVRSALAEAGIATLPTDRSSFDPIGTIWVDGPDVDSEGNPIPVPLDGWHANLRMTIPLSDEQAQALAFILIPKPAHPVRVWA